MRPPPPAPWATATIQELNSHIKANIATDTVAGESYVSIEDLQCVHPRYVVRCAAYLCNSRRHLTAYELWGGGARTSASLGVALTSTSTRASCACMAKYGIRRPGARARHAVLSADACLRARSVAWPGVGFPSRSTTRSSTIASNACTCSRAATWRHRCSWWCVPERQRPCSKQAVAHSRQRAPAREGGGGRRPLLRLQDCTGPTAPPRPDTLQLPGLPNRRGGRDRRYRKPDRVRTRLASDPAVPRAGADDDPGPATVAHLTAVAGKRL